MPQDILLKNENDLQLGGGGSLECN